MNLIKDCDAGIGIGSFIVKYSIFNIHVDRYVCKYRVNTLVTTKLSHIRLFTLEG